ncbi:hypothetical protein RRG08_026607 [Elysia crispata]|uniref:Uncharacterized protein n=1 Tax=Elysia crispata TaxID=231223 RepID=A0AAE1E6M4_9GAST|nr:hypothetical protein RRG08_026607 [Elysia crispata]
MSTSQEFAFCSDQWLEQPVPSNKTEHPRHSQVENLPRDLISGWNNPSQATRQNILDTLGIQASGKST